MPTVRGNDGEVIHLPYTKIGKKDTDAVRNKNLTNPDPTEDQQALVQLFQSNGTGGYPLAAGPNKSDEAEMVFRQGATGSNLAEDRNELRTESLQPDLESLDVLDIDNQERGADVQQTELIPAPPPPKPEPPKSKGSLLAGIIPASIRSMVSDVAGFDLETTRNEDYFGAEEKDVLRQLVARKIQRSGRKSGNIEYKDYDSKYEGVSFSDTGSTLYKLLTGDDEYSIKTTLGQFRYDIDERNHLIITDQYNFNDAEKLQKQNPTDVDRMMNLMTYADDIIDGSVGVYGIVRRAAGLWGSMGGEGAKFEIDLGPLAGF